MKKNKGSLGNHREGKENKDKGKDKKKIIFLSSMKSMNFKGKFWLISKGNSLSKALKLVSRLFIGKEINFKMELVKNLNL